MLDFSSISFGALWLRTHAVIKSPLMTLGSVNSMLKVPKVEVPQHYTRWIRMSFEEDKMDTQMGKPAMDDRMKKHVRNNVDTQMKNHGIDK